MYNVGDKFVIEIETEYGAHASYIDADMEKVPDVLYRVKGFRSLVFDENGLDRLERYDPDKIKKDAYDAGAAAAWNVARRIIFCKSDGGLSPKDAVAIFGTDSFSAIFKLNTAEEATNKIYEWRKNGVTDEIKVGDECVYKANPYHPFVITRIYYEDGNGFFDGLFMDGSVVYDGTLELIEKTGKHYPEIAKLFEATDPPEEHEPFKGESSERSFGVSSITNKAGKTIRIGDEVNINGVNGVVYYIDMFDDTVRWLGTDNIARAEQLHIAIQSKTGKAYPQLAEILGQMAEKKEDE